MKLKTFMTSLTLLSLGACTCQEEKKPQDLSSTEVAQRIPGHVKDREGWATDIVAAIKASEKNVSDERACAVIAVIEQESNFQADPKVQDLPRIVREGLLQKLSTLGPLAEPTLNKLLEGKAPGQTETFAARISKLRSEKDLDRFFRDMTAAYKEKHGKSFAVASGLSLLLGKGRLEDLNPVTTAGSMQVKVNFAREKNPRLTDTAVREQLYTRAGGVLYGTLRLLEYPARYDAIVYRFADFNAGPYSSRNAAFQDALSTISGQKLALDGDLLIYGEDGEPSEKESQSLRVMLSLAPQLELNESTIRRDLRSEKTEDFETSKTYRKIQDLYQKKTGKALPYARIPVVRLDSPKLSRELSTRWFAERVNRRYNSCRARANTQLNAGAARTKSMNPLASGLSPNQTSFAI